MTTLRLLQMNVVMLVGRLTRDPELRFTAKGQAVCRFDLAVNRRYKDVTGEWKDDTSFVTIVTWSETAQRCNDRLKKGSPVYVEGRLKSSSWETTEGQKRSRLEVVAQRVQFLTKTESGPEGAEPAGEAEPAPVEKAMASASGGEETAEEEIPF